MGRVLRGVGHGLPLGPARNQLLRNIIYTIPYSQSGSRFPAGTNPSAGLLANDSGALYGTTGLGRTGMCPGFPYAGCGVVFKLTPSESGYTESVLHAFQAGDDGWWPLAGLIADKHGALFGTTEYGGYANDGTVFKLTPSGSGYAESVVHAFAGGDDGALPVASLTLDAGGVLYGTTPAGGAASLGAVLSLTPSGSSYIESVVHAFRGGDDGAEPVAALVRDKTGMLYGTTMIGGASGVGTVFGLKQ